MKQNNIKNYKSGFTIIEIMISMAIFSIILLIFIEGIVRVTQSYYKGITQSNTQTAVRNITNDITQAIQFQGNGVTIMVPMRDYCIGDYLYYSAPGYEVSSNPITPAPFYQSYHGLMVLYRPSCASYYSIHPIPTINQPNPPGKELLSPLMRISTFDIHCTSGCPPGPSVISLWVVNIKIAYGDYDLLTTPANSANVKCNINSGSQYCAVEQLVTVVSQRLL